MGNLGDDACRRRIFHLTEIYVVENHLSNLVYCIYDDVGRDWKFKRSAL